jgi:hypothetical protein
MHDDPLALFFADERNGVPFTLRLFDRGRFGGEVAGQAGHDQDFDLDRRDTGDRRLLQGSGKIDMLWRIDDRGSFALLEGETSFRHRGRAGSPDDYTRSSSLSRTWQRQPRRCRPRVGVGIDRGRHRGEHVQFRRHHPWPRATC